MISPLTLWSSGHTVFLLAHLQWSLSLGCRSCLLLWPDSWPVLSPCPLDSEQRGGMPLDDSIACVMEIFLELALQHHWELKRGDAKGRIYPEWLYCPVQLAFSFCTLKPQSGADNQERFIESYMAVNRLLRATIAHVLAVFPDQSAPSNKWSHGWQMGSTSSALSKSLINQYITI